MFPGAFRQLLCPVSTKNDTFPTLQMGFRRVILLNKRKAVLFVICESQKRASAKWDRENMMIVGAKVRKEFAAEFKAACKAAGTSPNAVIKKAMADFIKSHRADGAE